MIPGTCIHPLTHCEMLTLVRSLDGLPVFPRAFPGIRLKRVRLRTGRKVASIRKLLGSRKRQLIHLTKIQDFRRAETKRYKMPAEKSSWGSLA